jgi:endoribonuclease Dicer
MSLSKGLASERAREVLNNPSSEFYLPLLCDCGKVVAKVVETMASNISALDEDLQPLDDGTEEGFAVLAQIQLDENNSSETDVKPDDIDISEEEDDLDWLEEQAVEDMLVAMDVDQD